MKILHLISSGGLFGAENILLTLGQAFNTVKDQAIVGAIRDRRYPQIDVIEKAASLQLPTFILESSGKIDPGAIFRLRDYLQQEKITVLHTHNYKSDIIGCCAARLAGIPIVATAHGFTDMTQSVFWYEKLDRWFLKNFFPKVVVVTDKMLPNLGAPKKVVIGNGLDASQFQHDDRQRKTYRERWGINADDIVIANIGRLSKEKNQRLLVKAAARLCAENKKLKFVIIGNGPEENDLKFLVEQEGLNRCVHFTGLIRNIVPVYSAIDIFAMTSLTEGIPVTILEAMAARVPVVATRVGGIPDLIEHEKTGLLIPSGDAEKLCLSVKRLVDDHGTVKDLTARAFEFVNQHFNRSQMVERYKNVYLSVLT